MRFLVWTCRLLLLIVVAAFVATLYYMTHGESVQDYMDPAMMALNLVVLIGSGLLGVVWSLARRYGQAFVLLISLGIARGLFGFPGSKDPKLLTGVQSDYLWFSIGVVGFALLATLTVRAIMSDRRLRAAKAAKSLQIPEPAVAVAEPAVQAPEAKVAGASADKATKATAKAAEKAKAATAEDKPEAKESEAEGSEAKEPEAKK